MRIIVGQDLLADLGRVADELGKTPTAREYDRLGQYSCQTVMSVHGSWNGAVRKLGMEPNIEHPGKAITDEEILESLRDMGDAGAGPTKREYDDGGPCSADTVVHRFGSWQQALAEIGLEPARPYEVDPDELLEDLRMVADKLGRSPSEREYEDCGGRYSAYTFGKAFGSWNGAKRTIGLDVEIPHWRHSDPRLRDAEWLKQKYEEQGLTIPEISGITGASTSAVYHALIRNGVETRERGRFAVYCDVMGRDVASPSERAFATGLDGAGLLDEAVYQPGRVKTDAGEWWPDWRIGEWLVECKRGCWGDLYGQAPKMELVDEPVLLFGIERDRRKLPHDLFVEYVPGSIPDLRFLAE